MSDTRLIFLKHGRIALPLIVVNLFISILKIVFDKTLINQIYGIGNLLLSVAFTIYALDSSIRLIGTCDDQLLLLSPKSRLAISLKNSLVLGAYLVLRYVAVVIPQLIAANLNLQELSLNFFAYVGSLVSGLSLMLLIIYVFKGVRKRCYFIAYSWISFLSVTAFLAYFIVVLTNQFMNQPKWIIGAVANETVTNLYAGILPITFIAINQYINKIIMLSLGNVIIGLLFLMSVVFLSRRRNDFLKKI